MSTRTLEERILILTNQAVVVARKDLRDRDLDSASTKVEAVREDHYMEDVSYESPISSFQHVPGVSNVPDLNRMKAPLEMSFGGFELSLHTSQHTQSDAASIAQLTKLRCGSARSTKRFPHEGTASGENRHLGSQLARRQR